MSQDIPAALDTPDQAAFRAACRAGMLPRDASYGLGNRYYFAGHDSRIVGDPTAPPTIFGAIISNWLPWVPDPAAWDADGGFWCNPADPSVAILPNGNLAAAAITPRSLFWPAFTQLSQPFGRQGWSGASVPIRLDLDLAMPYWHTATGDTIGIFGIVDYWGNPQPIRVDMIGQGTGWAVGLGTQAGVERFIFRFPSPPAPGSRHKLAVQIDPAAFTVQGLVDGVAATPPQSYRGPLIENEDGAFTVGTNGFGPGQADHTSGWNWPVKFFGGSLTVGATVIPISPPPPGDNQCPGFGLVVTADNVPSKQLPRPLLLDATIQAPPQAGAPWTVGTFEGQGIFGRANFVGGGAGFGGMQCGDNYTLHFADCMFQYQAVANAYVTFAIARFDNCAFQTGARDNLVMRGGNVTVDGGLLSNEAPRHAVACLGWAEGYRLDVRGPVIDFEGSPPAAHVFADGRGPAAIILGNLSLGHGPLLATANAPANCEGWVSLDNVTCLDLQPAAMAGGLTVKGSIHAG